MTQQLVPVSRSQPELARNIVLVADDYAMSAGISLGIESLARNGRISAASAIVTLPRWREDAPRLATLRDRIAIGLHINLTLGAPLTRMATIAPDGKFPEIAKLMRLPLLSRHDRAHAETEMALEIARQLAEFEDATGFAPDFLDGHQHVHALPVVRRAFFSALSRHYAEFGRRPLIRIPSERLANLVGRGRGGAAAKSGVLKLLAAGFRHAVLRAGFPANDTFAGVSAFRESGAAVSGDMERARKARGRLHLVMCHPGIPTPELDGLDTVRARRSAEMAFLGERNPLTDRLWRPSRLANGPVIDWGREREAM